MYTPFFSGWRIGGWRWKSRLDGTEVLIRIPRSLLRKHPKNCWIPFGYGRAWDELDSDQLVVAPLGLNWLIGWARALMIFLRRGPRCRG